MTTNPIHAIGCITALALAAGTPPPTGGAEAPGAGCYVKKETWAATLLASREAFARESAKADAGRPVTLEPWRATRPLKARGFAQALPPEKDALSQGKGALAPGKGGDPDAPDSERRRLWQSRPEWTDGVVHELPGSGTSSISTYLFRRLHAARPARIAASFGSDDGLQVWLNGKSIIERDVARGAGPDQDKVDLDLAAGPNALLVKIYNQTGNHAFYFALEGDRPAAGLPELWAAVRSDFPRESSWMERSFGASASLAWFSSSDSTELEKEGIARAIEEAGASGEAIRGRLDALGASGAAPGDPRWLELFTAASSLGEALRGLELVNVKALRAAITDLKATFGDRYPEGDEHLRKLAEWEGDVAALGGATGAQGDVAARMTALGERIAALQRDALLSSPLFDFDRLIVVKRAPGQLGLPQNWQGNCALPRNGYDNEIDILSPIAPDGRLARLYKPEDGRFVGDVDLEFDGGKMLFSMPGSHGRWQIWEVGADGSGLRQVTRGEEPDVDNYDACYLPDGRIVYGSTACFHGVPCVGGGNTVANLFIANADGTGARQICFDQDHDWCPTMMNDGRVMYSRWEYSDTPHYFSRLLFKMNPDGTGQMAIYKSNSYWPNSIFYARPIPDHPSKVIAVISGHHGVPRMGELILFDPASGTKNGGGAVQRIPGQGKRVDPIIRDALVDGSWPRFLHPYPLSDKFFLVSCQPTPQSAWGIYLVDTFDNRILIREEPGYALLEPVPLRKTRRPPAMPDRIRRESREATVYLSDVYRGDGLQGVPRGAVKRLRVYELHYTYPNMGGHINVGLEGPWDVHRILGTVPVNEDGSAAFTVPANTPVAVQPLDAEGKALQLMRSWFVGMPGEVVSCVGCHERQNDVSPSRPTLAYAARPIEPWYGPARGFSFKREVQPVLDDHCVGCHDGREAQGGAKLPDFRASERNGWGNFTPSYLALQPYVRRPGPESDYHLQVPLEYHADTSELLQMLRKGHHGVRLDAEAWDRLVTWIDLNVPDHGTWGEHARIPSNFHQRRLEMRTKYANRPEDPEAIPAIAREPRAAPPPAPEPASPVASVACPSWPFPAEEAKKRQEAAGPSARRSVDLGNGVQLELVLVPAGEFVLGDPEGFPDEQPPTRVSIARAFWLGACEITNRQYALFDPLHDSGFVDRHNKDQSDPGFPANLPDQPVVRVSQEEALAFCRWLSQRSGCRFSLPTEAQWEWACRAGESTPFSHGGLDADFSKHANLADAALRAMALGDGPQDFPPKDHRWSDGATIESEVGRYQPNAWGLRDMHGNVQEWTRSAYRPYPYADDDGRNDAAAAGDRVIRGGSWCDRPRFARSASRLAYKPWQKVFNVGFRVLMEDGPAAPAPQVQTAAAPAPGKP